MAQGYVLAFTEGVEVEKPSAGCAVVRSLLTWKKYCFDDLSPGLARALELLVSGGATEGELAQVVAASDGDSALVRLYYGLEIFAAMRALAYGISCGGQPLAVLSPASPSFRFSPASVDPQSRFVLSRFAYLHREGANLVLESPLAHGKITIHDRQGAAIIAQLAGERTPDTLCRALDRFPEETAALLLEMLVSAGFVTQSIPGLPFPGESEALAQWEFHDLLFHSRNRKGRHANPVGATYRFHGKINPLPAVKPAGTGKTIDLHTPDISTLESEDYPFTLVLERRRSIREYADKPITDRQLGEFLFRSARIKEMWRREVQDVSTRPYPGAGAIYELELYVNVGSCENLARGLYHYCPKAHRLEELSGPEEAVAALLRDAAGAVDLQVPPQILIIVAVRFQRLSWKYESVAYSLCLKNVGVLFQTMYLTATAMDLAPCALGGGDSDLFARAAGLDYVVETSVGEFLLGSKRT